MEIKDILKIVLVDIIILSLIVFQLDSSTSVAIFLVLPYIVITNLILSMIFIFIKIKKGLYKLFLINTIIAPLIFYYFSLFWISIN